MDSQAEIGSIHRNLARITTDLEEIKAKLEQTQKERHQFGQQILENQNQIELSNIMIKKVKEEVDQCASSEDV